MPLWSRLLAQQHVAPVPALFQKPREPANQSLGIACILHCSGCISGIFKDTQLDQAYLKIQVERWENAVFVKGEIEGNSVIMNAHRAGNRPSAATSLLGKKLSPMSYLLMILNK